MDKGACCIALVSWRCNSYRFQSDILWDSFGTGICRCVFDPVRSDKMVCDDDARLERDC